MYISLFRLQDNSDVLKRLKLLKSTMLRSRLFRIWTTLSQEKYMRTFNLE